MKGVEDRSPDSIASLFKEATESLLASSARVGCRVELPSKGRLLVAGDLHDHLPNFNRLVAAADLHEPDHHLVLQELIHGPTLLHGCDMSWRMLARVADLILSHPGQVHPLLGNHENSQLTGVGVTKGGGNSVEQFEDGVRWHFGEDWDLVGMSIHRFLEAMPLAVRTAKGIQCTHSLPDAVLMNRFDSTILDRSMEGPDRRGPDGAAYLLTWGRRFSDEQTTALAEAWGVSHLIIGHVRIDGGIERMGENVIALASDHDGGAALPVDLAAIPDTSALMDAAVPLQLLPIIGEG